MKNLQLLAVCIMPVVFFSTSKADTTTASQGKPLCQAQVIVPARFQAATETLVTREASPDFSTTPVQMGYGEKKIKVADAYVEYEVIPATFKEVSEEIEVERERVEIGNQPATYRTETKHLKVREASVQWNPACPPATGGTDIPANCLLEIPAEYQDITREVVDMPARTLKKTIPAKTQTITRKILVEPAKVVRKEIPAVYETIQLSRVDQPARVSSTPGQEQTQEVAVQRKVHPERFITMPALCEDTLDSNDIARLQQLLQQQGYYAGAPDGRLDAGTRTALTRFQQENQLASGAITLETLQKLKFR